MFKLFWPLSSSSPAVTIPTYLSGPQEDSIDLQIKSLAYMFNRYRIDKLSQFLICDEPGRYRFEYVEPARSEGNEKLDVIYNKTQFEEELIKDEFRIVIDFVRNKFRSMLILSDYPKGINQIPKLHSAFSFTVLRPDSSDEIYSEVLINKSHIYEEFKVPYDVRLGILKKVLSNQRRAHMSTHFDKTDRAFIIRSYVQRLGFHIQVERIYKASLRSKEIALKPIDNAPRLKHKQSAPVLRRRSELEEPPRLTTRPSRRRLNAASPRLSQKPSMSILKVDRMVDDSGSDHSDPGIFMAMTQEEKRTTYDQCKCAVRIRIEREKQLIKRIN